MMCIHSKFWSSTRSSDFFLISQLRRPKKISLDLHDVYMFKSNIFILVVVRVIFFSMRNLTILE
jgi:hypothetical protein